MLLSIPFCRCGRSSGVERNLAKVDVEGPNPFARSIQKKPLFISGFFLCGRRFSLRLKGLVFNGRDLSLSSLLSSLRFAKCASVTRFVTLAKRRSRLLGSLTNCRLSLKNNRSNGCFSSSSPLQFKKAAFYKRLFSLRAPFQPSP